MKVKDWKEKDKNEKIEIIKAQHEKVTPEKDAEVDTELALDPEP